MVTLSDEQAALRDAVRELARDKIAPRAAQIDETAEFPHDIVELLAQHDILALPYPAEHGGLGGDLLTVLVAIEELSKVSAAVGLILAVHELSALPLMNGGTDEQKQRWLPDLAAGRMLAAFALTESGAGSDAASLRTTAKRDGDDWIINGEKRFISHADVAGITAVFALTDPRAEAVKAKRHLSCFYVEKDTPGFSVPRLEHKMGIRGSSTAELAFSDARVPDANRVGELGDGWQLAMKTFERSRPGIGAQAVGIAQGALEAALDYANQRRQFGRKIGEHQMVAAMLADMATRTEAARQLLYAAAERISAGDPSAARWAAMAKLFGGDTAMAVTTDAVQVFGGYGYTSEYPVERMMRDAKITQLYEGTQQIQRLIIARDLLAAQR
ncbi:MAG TPA: acyl-CoA dehydrogenase family protein [Candidatus Limnocylindria bacterium]|nr:acyl-CoA dehydrogenase family protein [Candidatus Limnocylindria bacterium]